MTGFSRFLNESKYTTFYDTMGIIYKDCMPFIKSFCATQQADNNLLFRGVNENKKFIKKTTRTDRKPGDTHQLVHADIDKAFIKRFGYPARSSSVFVSGSAVAPSEYGDVYMMFPIGKYKFLWNPRIRDLYVYINDVIGMAGAIDKRHGDGKTNPFLNYYVKSLESLANRTSKDEFRKEFDEKHGEGKDGKWVYIDSKGVSTNIPKGQDPKQYASAKTKETVTLKWVPRMNWAEFAKEYWYDFEKASKMDSLEKATKIYNDKISEMVDGYVNKNLKGAVISGHEIMIQCNEYYLFSARDSRRRVASEFLSLYKDKFPGPDEVKVDFIRF